jgi:hypothetical protein
LDCFRLVLQQSVDPSIEDEVRGLLQEVIRLVLQTVENVENGPKYVRKCSQNMIDVRLALQYLAEKLNSAAVLGRTLTAELSETMEFQRVSLIQQHESLAVILHYLVKSNFANVAEFEHLLDTLRQVDKFDNLLGKCFYSSNYTFRGLFTAERYLILVMPAYAGSRSFQRANVDRSTLPSRNGSIHLCLWSARWYGDTC